MTQLSSAQVVAANEERWYKRIEVIVGGGLFIIAVLGPMFVMYARIVTLENDVATLKPLITFSTDAKVKFAGLDSQKQDISDLKVLCNSMVNSLNDLKVQQARMADKLDTLTKK